MAWDNTTRPSRKKIVEYWNSDEGRQRFDFPRWSGTDACFACDTDIRLQRAHIVGRRLGGPDTVDNFVVLCHGCHRDSPDPTDPAELFDWIAKGPTPEERFMARHGPEFDRLPEGMLDDLERVEPEVFMKALKEALSSYGMHGLETSPATFALALRKVHAQLMSQRLIPLVIENHVVRTSSIRGTSPVDPEWKGPRPRHSDRSGGDQGAMAP